MNSTLKIGSTRSKTDGQQGQDQKINESRLVNPESIHEEQENPETARHENCEMNRTREIQTIEE